MSTAYDELQDGMFTALGYPKTPYDGNFQWTGDIPSAPIIAAVQALPQASANAFYSLDLALNEEGQTLQAPITQTQWNALLIWQRSRCAAACGTALAADATYQWEKEKAVLRGTSTLGAKTLAERALAAANLSVTLD